MHPIIFAVFTGFLGAVSLSAGATSSAQATSPIAQAATHPHVTMFKSPTCGCCGKWAEYMREAGFHVQEQSLEDMTAKKDELGGPDNLRSCHTAVVDGYVVEGHVPVDAITKMLHDKPKTKGIAVPGMPMDSPGMMGDGQELTVKTFEGAVLER